MEIRAPSHIALAHRAQGFADFADFAERLEIVGRSPECCWLDQMQILAVQVVSSSHCWQHGEVVHWPAVLLLQVVPFLQLAPAHPDQAAQPDLGNVDFPLQVFDMSDTLVAAQASFSGIQDVKRVHRATSWVLTFH